MSYKDKVVFGIFGFCTIDVLDYLPNSPRFLGGGALSTSLWLTFSGHRVFLYTCCGRLSLNKIVNKLRGFQERLTIVCMDNCLKNKSTTTTRIYIDNEEYRWVIDSKGSWKDIAHILDKVKNIIPADRHGIVYIKLPLNIIQILSSVINKNEITAINPTGECTLDSLKTIPTKIVFLNIHELYNITRVVNLYEGVHSIERLNKDFVITLGSRGALYYANSNNRWYYMPAINSKGVKDTLGCGDAFAAGFLSAIREGDIEKSLILGTLFGYISAHIYGTLPPPSVARVLSHINRVNLEPYRRYIVKTNDIGRLISIVTARNTAYISAKMCDVLIGDNIKDLLTDLFYWRCL